MMWGAQRIRGLSFKEAAVLCSAVRSQNCEWQEEEEVCPEVRDSVQFGERERNCPWEATPVINDSWLSINMQTQSVFSLLWKVKSGGPKTEVVARQENKELEE